MRGVFFVPPSILAQPATTAQKDGASARGNPTTFRENSSCFPKKSWIFRRNSSTPHPTRSPFAPFPTTTTRQLPPFGRKIREKSPNHASISTIHGFSPSKTVFSDASTPFQATLPRTLLCQKTAICAKSPLFCHFVAEKRPATWGFLQTFFIFAF